MRALIIALLAVVAATVPAIASAQTGAPTAPEATTGEAGAITRTTATLTGTADPNGTATSYRFEYGTSNAYGLETPVTSAGMGEDPAAVEAAIEGLTSSTTYHYRIVATNAAGVARGQDRTLRTAATTPNPSAPSVSTTGARGVGTTSATLVGRVDPNRAATTVRFEYGPSTAYGSSTRSTDAGAGDAGRTVALPVGRLRPRTTYHLRVVATNAAGTSRGRDRTSAPSPPLGPSPSRSNRTGCVRRHGHRHRAGVRHGRRGPARRPRGAAVPLWRDALRPTRLDPGHQQLRGLLVRHRAAARLEPYARRDPLDRGSGQPGGRCARSAPGWRPRLPHP